MIKSSEIKLILTRYFVNVYLNNLCTCRHYYEIEFYLTIPQNYTNLLVETTH